MKIETYSYKGSVVIISIYGNYYNFTINNEAYLESFDSLLAAKKAAEAIIDN